MTTVETCPECGAERPSWLGGSHRNYNHKLLCSDGNSPEWVWRNHAFLYTRRPSHWGAE